MSQLRQQRRLWITVPDDLHSKLDELSEKTGVSRSAIVERVLCWPDLMEWAALRLAADATRQVAYVKEAA